MEGPDHTYDMPSYVRHSLERLASEADAAPALARQIPPGGLMAALETVIRRTAAQPVVVPVIDKASGLTQQVRFGPEDVQDMAAGYTAAATSRAGMRTWASDILTLYRGDFGPAAEARVRNHAVERFRTASYFMLDCGSGISPARRTQMEADRAAALLGPPGFNYDAACPEWKIDLGDAFRRNVDTQIPTVIVQGDYDISTPLENALELAPHFKNGRLIVVHGGSHPALDDAMDASPAFAAAILAFARSGDSTGLPPEVQLPPIAWVVPPAPDAVSSTVDQLLRFEYCIQILFSRLGLELPGHAARRCFLHTRRPHPSEKRQSAGRRTHHEGPRSTCSGVARDGCNGCSGPDRGGGRRSRAGERLAGRGPARRDAHGDKPDGHDPGVGGHRR